MNRMRLYACLGLLVGIPLVFGCFSNGADQFDSKHGSLGSASGSNADAGCAIENSSVSNACVGCDIGAEEGKKAPDRTEKKVAFKIAIVGMAGACTQNPWDQPVQLTALQKLPYSEDDIAKAPPGEALRMDRANRECQLTNQRVREAIAIDAYAKAQERFEGTKRRLEGTVFGRQVILAADKFAGMAGEYFDPDCIELIPGTIFEAHKGEMERLLKDMGSADTLSKLYFINLLFDNPRIETSTADMNGQMFKRTKISIAVIYQVQLPNGRLETAGIVKKEKALKSFGAVRSSGTEESALVDTMDEALAEVAKRINDHFVAKVTIKVVSAGGKNDKDFDAEAASVNIDGVPAKLDSEISIVKGKHTIVVDLDEYKQKGPITFNIKKSGPIKVVLRKDAAKKEADAKVDEANQAYASKAVFTRACPALAENMRPLVWIDRDNIENNTDRKDADFSAITDLMNQELVETGFYRVINKDDLVGTLKMRDFRLIRDDDIRDNGGGETKIAAPSFSIGMTINSYGITSVVGQNALTGAASVTEVGKIDMVLKVMDARTGKTIKAVNVSDSAMGQMADAASDLRQQVLQTATKKACEKIVYELIKLTPFGILDVKNDAVSLNVPGTLKIMGKPLRPGTQFAVSKLGKKVMHTGKVLRSETLVAVVEVTAVGKDSCSARILSGAIPPIGDDEDTQYDLYIVRINEVAHVSGKNS